MPKKEILVKSSRPHPKTIEKVSQLPQKVFLVSAHFFALGAGWSWAIDYRQEAVIGMGLAAIAAVLSSDQLRQKFIK